jgi:B12 binding protein
VAEVENEIEQVSGEGDDNFALLWVAVPLCALIVGTSALYFAKPVLLPLAIALILGVVFSPVASRLVLLRKDGSVATFAGEDESQAEISDLVKRFAPDFVFISCSTSECLSAALKLVPAIRSVSSRMTIIAGGVEALEQSDGFIKAGCAQVCAGTSEARRAVRDFILQRAKSRLPFGALLSQRIARSPLPSTERAR